MKVLFVVALAAMSLSIVPTTTEAGRAFPPEVKAARAYALKRLGPTQFQCLHNIVERESHWNPRAHNRWSGAHGIGQALPASKMRRFGRDYMTNPTTQMKWLLVYIRKYGSACGAWSFWRAHGWY